jgi:hypothetical protein
VIWILGWRPTDRNPLLNQQSKRPERELWRKALLGLIGCGRSKYRTSVRRLDAPIAAFRPRSEQAVGRLRERGSPRAVGFIRKREPSRVVGPPTHPDHLMSGAPNALSNARQRAVRGPATDLAIMGYPWIDLTRNALEFAAANDQGKKAALPDASVLRAAGLTESRATAQASITRLDEISDDASHLVDAGVPHADLIWMTEPDQKNNPVVITVSALNADLMSALASRYGTELIEVRVRSGGPLGTANRDSDAPAFWGGAYITTSTGKACTTGFAWTDTQSAMLTAAHCISTGGNVSYPSYSNVGTVTSGSRENWSDFERNAVPDGTNCLPRRCCADPPQLPRLGGEIYSGDAHTSTSSAMKSMASRWSSNGDTACVNGVVTGEWCGAVTITGGNAWYLVNGINVWARHVVQAEALGPHCPTHGDSGAPVYRKVTDGVAAVGILSPQDVDDARSGGQGAESIAARRRPVPTPRSRMSISASYAASTGRAASCGMPSGRQERAGSLDDTPAPVTAERSLPVGPDAS